MENKQPPFEDRGQNQNVPTTPPFTTPNPPLYQKKKSNAVPIVIAIIFAITAIIIASIICFFAFLRGGISELAKNHIFDNDSSYIEVNTSAEFDTDNILELDIEWIDGSVNLQYYDGEKIYIEENGNGKHPMCYKIDGTTLKIDEYRNKAKINIKTASKDLTIKLPLTYKANKIDISVVSASVAANGLNVGKLDFETVSGNGEFQFAVSPVEIDTESVSGEAKIILPEGVTGYSASWETVSGSLITNGFTDNSNSARYGDGSVLIDGDSVSGNLIISKAEAKKAAA